jgi:hypothetical protein
MMRSTYRFGAVATVAVIAAALFAERGPAAQSTPLPFTFYPTHYQLLGDANDPTGVRYHSRGRPFAKARDGSRIILTGQGGWDPVSARATGGVQYTIRGPRGAVKTRGTWRVTRFISFLQLAGWWGIPDFQEQGWQGPAGSASFSGFLKVRVKLEKRGAGVLTAWCLMPGVRMPGDHVSDGISLSGPVSTVIGFSPTTAIGSPHWWPCFLPTGGHEFSP